MTTRNETTKRISNLLWASTPAGYNWEFDVFESCCDDQKPTIVVEVNCSNWPSPLHKTWDKEIVVRKTEEEFVHDLIEDLQ